jgi:hypothetical protein
MDALVMENVLLLKEEQPTWAEGQGYAENDDATPIIAAPKDKLHDALSELFDTTLLPIARAASARVNARFRPPREGKTFWRDYTGPVDARTVFPIHPALDGAADDAFHDQAVAIIRGFSATADFSSETFLPLVTRLLELGARGRTDEELEEEVSQSIYVMF